MLIKWVLFIILMVIGENPELHLLIVDDNSPDGTGEKIKKLQTEHKNLFLETRPKKSVNLMKKIVLIYGKNAGKHVYKKLFEYFRLHLKIG